MNINSLVTTINPEITRRLATALIHSTWLGAAGGIALVVLLRLMRNWSANARYVAAYLTLVAICGATVVTFFAAAAPPHRHLATAGMVAAAPVGPAITADRPAEVDAPLPPSMLNFAVAAWVAGVALLSMWQIGGWCWLQVIRRSGKAMEMEVMARLARMLDISRAVALVETARVDMPAVVGVWRPVILAPVGFFTGLAPAQVEAILAHELAHVRRWDYLANLVQSLIETLLFYHPCVWWISSQIRQEREHCCDDVAAEIAGDRVMYAETLVMMEGRRAPMLSLAAGGGMLSRRVRRLIGAPARQSASRHRSMRASRRSAVAGIIAAACVLAVVLNRVAPAQTEKAVKAVVAATTQAANAILPEDLVSEPHDYQIGANDLLNVGVNDLTGPGVQTVKSVRVGEKSGDVSLPLVGNVHLIGLTVGQAERAVAKAYTDAQLLRDPQVSVTVAEARAKTFSILGSQGIVAKPGEYAIVKSDFRLLDALALGGTQPSKVYRITVMRKEGNGTRRIDVPTWPLVDGDAKYNIVIRPGDFIFVAEPERRFIRVIVDQDAMYLRDAKRGWAADKKVDWSRVEEYINAMGPPDRSATVLEIGMASRDLPYGKFMDAQAAGNDLVKKYSLAYLSDVGVQAVETASGPPPVETVYYIGGHVKRVGVYQIAKAPISIRAAIIAAGMHDDRGKSVQLYRLSEGDRGSIVLNAPLDEQLSDPKLDTLLQPNDQLMVLEKLAPGSDSGNPAPSAAVPGAQSLVALVPPGLAVGTKVTGKINVYPNPGGEGGAHVSLYYVGGHVAKPGLYELKPGATTTVRQAIIAAGMQAGDGRFVDVQREQGTGWTSALRGEALDQGLTNAKLDMPLRQNDTITITDTPTAK